MSRCIATSLRLDRGDGDGVDDVLDQRAAGQVVDRLAQALQHRADRDGAGAALHRLVGVVAGVEVGEDQHRRPAGHRGVRHLGGRDRRLDRGVVLDRPLDQQVAARARAPVRLRPGPCRRRRRCRSRRWSRTASPPAARCRTARRCAPRRSRCRPAAPRSGRGRSRSRRRPAPGRPGTSGRRWTPSRRPGAVLMISNAGRMVCAVVCAAPETMPSAMSLCTIMVPKYETSWMISRACSTVTPLCLRSCAYCSANWSHSSLVRGFEHGRRGQVDTEFGRARARICRLVAEDGQVGAPRAAAAGRPPCRIRSSSPSGSTMRLRSDAGPLHAAGTRTSAAWSPSGSESQAAPADPRYRRGCSISSSAVSILRCEVAVTRPRADGDRAGGLEGAQRRWR